MNTACSPVDACAASSQCGQAARDFRKGAVLVLLAAMVWSLGGVFSRMLDIADNWTVVFWRSFWAAAFLLAYMLQREGLRGTRALFSRMGWPGFGVGLCFAIASSAFVVALSYTTVANVLLVQAGVPLFAALITWVLFRERIGTATWVAIFAVIGGVGLMVSESLTGTLSPVGSALALLVALSFACATVISRRYAHVRMAPAVCLGTLLAGALAAGLSGGLAVSAPDMLVLVGFGALNLGLGMALFVAGVRLVPAAVAALISTAEPILGPVWVWLVHGEIPSSRTLVGGGIVLVALVAHIGWQMRGRSRLDVSAGS